MKALWLVNGRETGVDPSDRGLAYGDGLFETMASVDGRIRWLEYHFERLERGCRRLGIVPPDRDLVKAEIDAHCPRSGRAIVKLIVTRGPGERGYRPPDAPKSTRILGFSAWHEHPSSHYSRGIRVRVCGLRLGASPALAGLKHLCRLEQVLAQIELRGHDVEQGLLLDTTELVVGGSSSNVFAVRGAELLTPAVTRNGIAGVMRRVVLEEAPLVGLVAREVDLALHDLTDADELFVTNALIGIWPVARLDERVFARGPATVRLMQRLGYGGDA
ncbi:MAG TPA: aminodeoxychorismate lyase [Gammaproteobacteria bacterium]|nr:aminodeoxychorismate lyase [Gammaproteobacteria bacterium]